MQPGSWSGCRPPWASKPPSPLIVLEVREPAAPALIDEEDEAVSVDRKTGLAQSIGARR